MSGTPEIRRDETREVRCESGRGVVAEPPRETPVVRNVDVLVVGAGPAGVGAALAAGREGAKTLLLERHGMLGGMWTAGLVNPFFEFHAKGWLVAELIQKLKDDGAWKPWSRFQMFDPEAMVLTLEAMMATENVEFWYHAPVTEPIVENGVVRGAIVESKAGREAVIAHTTIDCTGDGDVAARAGAPYEFGRIEDGVVQPMTMMFEMSGVPSDFVQSGENELYDAMAEAIETHNLPESIPIPRSVCHAPWLLSMPRAGSGVVQGTHVFRLNPLDTRELTKGIVDARRQAQLMANLIGRIPGLEGTQLVRTAPSIGIRETRRINGAYRLTKDDLAEGRHFDDGITNCGFGIDIHEPAPGSGIPRCSGRVKPYEIPYRCLLPEGMDGLLTAGRCISGSHEAHASYRVTGSCMGMGQAAGLAAAKAVQAGNVVRDVNGSDLKQLLAERGVNFDR